MYLQYIPHMGIVEFINQINGNDTSSIARNLSNDDIMIVKSKHNNIVFHISDFDCVDVTNGVSYLKEWCPLMIKELDKIDKRLGIRYVNDLHDYLEQGTIVGPAL